MSFDFDAVPNRKQTHSYKWDQVEALFGDPGILPLWVADMDFESPPAVKKAMERRASLGIYGYTIKPEEYDESIVRWYARRHNWTIQKEWLVHTCGIVTILSLAVELFSEPDAPVILQSPVYYPFYDVIRMNGRKIANNPLLLQGGRYEMDYAQLEQLMKDGAKLLLLCNPHNPGGRVWERAELERLGELCLRYGVTVVSDEIHCDLALPGHTHIPFASLSPELADITVTALAPTKTFNLPGVPAAFAVASNPVLRRKLLQRVKTLSIHMMNYYAVDAVPAAYNEGEEWLDGLLAYIRSNLDYAIGYIRQHIPAIKPMDPEGSYLLWLDCRGLGLDVPGLKELMYRKARVAFNEGSVYGEEGSGFLRVNVACQRNTLEEALQRFAGAVGQLKG